MQKSMDFFRDFIERWFPPEIGIVCRHAPSRGWNFYLVFIRKLPLPLRERAGVRGRENRVSG